MGLNDIRIDGKYPHRKLLRAGARMIYHREPKSIFNRNPKPEWIMGLHIA